MAFFFREDGHRHRSPERRYGKACNIRGPEPIVLKAVQTREEYMDQAVAAMADTQANGHLQIGKKEPPRRTGRLPGDPQTARHDSGPLFGSDGKPLTPPAMRIRIGVTDEELRKIWHEDDRKAQVAAQMEAKPTMVDKMLDYNYPLPHPGHEPTSKKKQAHLEVFREPTAKCEPQGFKGMGHFSAPVVPCNPRIRPTEFEPPVLIPKKLHGRRHIPVGDESIPIAERPRLLA